MENDRRRTIKGDWFQLNIRFGDSVYKEITKIRKFDYQSLIGECRSNKSNAASSTLFQEILTCDQHLKERLL